MGGKSSSSSNTTTTNTSGSVAAQGDNNGVMISGVNDSTIDLTLSDYGAIEGALGLAEEVISQSSATSQHAVDAITSMAGQQNATTQAAIAMANDAKAREQTGENESNNEVMRVLIIGFVITAIAFIYIGGKS